MKAKLAVASFIAAVLFATLGLLLPPTGIIDASVNMLVAQLLVLTATLLGVDSYYTKIRDLQIGKHPDKPPEK